MSRTYLLAALSASLFAPLSHAQRFLIPQENPKLVRLIDANAGCLAEQTVFDLSSITPEPVSIRDAQRVGSEVWVSSARAIHRFDSVTQTYLGDIHTGWEGGHLGMDMAGGNVWVAAREFLFELSPSGSVLNQFSVDDAYDLFEHNGELIVSNNSSDRIDRYDLAGNFVATLVSNAGQGYLEPQAIAPRTANGNLLVIALPRVLEYTMSGTFVIEYQAGAFEQGLQEMSDGRLLVTNAPNMSILDPNPANSNASTIINTMAGAQAKFISPFDAGSGAYTRHCQAASNSLGAGAIISAFGFPSVTAGSTELLLSVNGLPPEEPGLYVYSDSTTQAPFGDGFLCVPLGSNAHRFPKVTYSSLSGRVQNPIPFSALPSGGQISAGSTWNFQYLYRDPQSTGARFNGTDAIGVTFRP
jgi:DNA-binding beta-propeller fold protein YncE